MNNHTPGPWVVTSNCDYWVEHTNGSEASGDFLGVALCGDMTWHGSEDRQREWEANTRLIAAAPDMLEALQEIKTMWQYGEGFTNEIEAQVSAAIAKASVKSS